MKKYVEQEIARNTVHFTPCWHSCQNEGKTANSGLYIFKLTFYTFKSLNRIFLTVRGINFVLYRLS